MIKLGANSVHLAVLRNAFKYIAWAGYDGIELSAIGARRLNSTTGRHRKTKFRAKPAVWFDLLSMEEAALDEERLEKAFAAAEAGSPVINVGLTARHVEEDFDRQVALLGKMADRAHAHGVTMCVKAHVGHSIQYSYYAARDGND